MWPWMWMWPVMPHRSRAECDQAHDRVQAAATEFSKKQREKESVDKEARHAARNNRMLLAAVLDRLGRRNDE